MRVLLAAGATDIAPAGQMTRWAARPWPRVTAVPLSDGGGDLCEVLAELAGGELGALGECDQLIPTLRSGGTWVCDLSAWHTDTAMLGTALAAGLRTDASRIVLAVSSQIVPDLGRAMLKELGLTGLADVAARVAGRDIVILANEETSLLGPAGLPRALAASGRLPGEVAQELERDLVRSLPSDGTPRRQLEGERLAATDPLSGAGGGAGFLLSRIGARIERAGSWCASYLLPEVAKADLIVAVTGNIGLDLPASVQSLARMAAAHSLPVVLVYGEGALLRHELARDGLSGAYSYGEGGQRELEETMRRVAQTWLGPLMSEES